MDKNFLYAKLYFDEDIISTMTMEEEVHQELVISKLTMSMAKAILESEKFEYVENSDPHTKTRTYIGRIIVLDKDEYNDFIEFKRVREQDRQNINI